MSSGWVQLHRQIIHSAVFASADLLKVWTWCLCRASYDVQHFPIKTGRGETVVTVQPGQFIFGRSAAAAVLGMKESTLAARMKKLERLGNISIKPNSHYSIITVCNWSTYQVPKQATGQATDNQPTGNGQATDKQRTHTTRNNKSTNNKNKAAKPPADGFDLAAVTWAPHLDTKRCRVALAEWAAHKQTMPSRWKTQRGPQGLVNAFHEYSADQFVQQINLALAHGSAKAPWPPSHTFGKTKEQTRPGAVPNDPSLKREMDRAGRITTTRDQIRETKDEAQRLSLEESLNRLLDEPEGATR